MLFGCIFQIAMLATAILAGLGNFSFWWTLIPAFFAASLSISNGPGFDLVIHANQEGRLAVLPRLLIFNILPWLALAGAAYGITSALSK